MGHMAVGYKGALLLGLVPIDTWNTEDITKTQTVAGFATMTWNNPKK